MNHAKLTLHQLNSRKEGRSKSRIFYGFTIVELILVAGRLPKLVAIGDRYWYLI